MNTIKYANKTALWIIIINLVVAVICSFLPVMVGELATCLILSIFALIRAKKGQIDIPIGPPRLKVTFLCVAITVTGFPIALFLNYLGSRLTLGGAATGQMPYAFWQAILVSALFPAIVEEITFRGLLQGAFMKESAAYSILFSSLFFALIHSNISAVLYAFFYGCIFALIRLVTGNLAYTMIMHVTFNTINICLAYLCPNLNLSNGWIIALGVIIGLLFCLMLGLFIYHNDIHFNEEKRPIRDIVTAEGVVALGICFFIMITFTILR